MCYIIICCHGNKEEVVNVTMCYIMIGCHGKKDEVFNTKMCYSLICCQQRSSCHCRDVSFYKLSPWTQENCLWQAVLFYYVLSCCFRLLLTHIIHTHPLDDLWPNSLCVVCARWSLTCIIHTPCAVCAKICSVPLMFVFYIKM